MLMHNHMHTSNAYYTQPLDFSLSEAKEQKNQYLNDDYVRAVNMCVCESPFRHKQKSRRAYISSVLGDCFFPLFFLVQFHVLFVFILFAVVSVTVYEHFSSEMNAREKTVYEFHAMLDSSLSEKINAIENELIHRLAQYGVKFNKISCIFSVLSPFLLASPPHSMDTWQRPIRFDLFLFLYEQTIETNNNNE